MYHELLKNTGREGATADRGEFDSERHMPQILQNVPKAMHVKRKRMKRNTRGIVIHETMIAETRGEGGREIDL
jgi:hypothetical protein